MSGQADFYHLMNKTLEQVLPKLIEKAYSLQKSIKIQIGNESKLEPINELLWSYDAASFLPHGSPKNGQGKKQPIWLSTDDKVPNNAKFLFLVEKAMPNLEKTEEMERIFIIFNGKAEEELLSARALYKELKNKDFELKYWQETENGWQQKN